MTLRERKARNSRERYARAPGVLPKTTLDAEQNRALSALLAARGCTVSALLRSLLLDAASRLAPNPVDESGTRVDAGGVQLS